jgi:hypothetical protein
MAWCLDWYIARGGGGFQVLRQGIELGFPEDPIGFDPRAGVFHVLGSEAAAVDAAINFAAEQTGGFENPKVLGDGREGDIEGGG